MMWLKTDDPVADFERYDYELEQRRKRAMIKHQAKGYQDMEDEYGFKDEWDGFRE